MSYLATEYWSNGCIRYMKELNADNVLHGAQTMYHENGLVHAITTYKNGVLHGISKWFGMNGLPTLLCEYYEGNYEGNVYIYNLDGKVILTESYSRGKLLSINDGIEKV
jgi:antitoxin component YwqK of YwqJK toxin-antitoxin module